MPNTRTGDARVSADDNTAAFARGRGVWPDSGGFGQAQASSGGGAVLPRRLIAGCGLSHRLAALLQDRAITCGYSTRRAAC